MAQWRAVLAIVWFLLVGGSLPAAADTINAALDVPSIELLPHLQAVTTDQPAVSIEVPSATPGQTVLLPLEAKGFGPSYRWIVASLANPSSAPQDVVMLVPHQGFVGSGIFWPKPQGTRIVSLTSIGGAAPVPLADYGADALSLRIDPGQTVTVALEMDSGDVSGMRLWQRQAFDANSNAQSFFHGVILGLAILVGLVAISLYAVRISSAFPAAALFVWASVGFIAIEAGYLPAIRGWLASSGLTAQEIRALIESLMLTGLALCLVSFVELRKRMPVAGNLVLAFACLTLALPIYGLFEPSYTTGLARFAFAVVAVVGFVIIVTLWRAGFARAQSSLLSWAALVIWTFVAAIAVLSPEDDAVLRMLILAGLTLVLLMIGLTLVQFSLSPGVLSRRTSEDAMRRMRALAGSQQYVWEWKVLDQELFVGDELERALGLKRGYLAQGGQQAWFALIHPADRRAYQTTIETAERRGRGGFTQDFRLQRADGSYRWFRLRGRAMPGADRTALTCVGTLSDVTSERRLQDRLLSDAVHDRATGLPNRALLVDRIARAMAKSGAPDAGDVYLLIIDLDRFKSVNDGLGHETGDQLLNITGRRLLATASPEDTVARLPGDQFAILLDNSNLPRDPAGFAKTIRRAISVPIRLREQEIFLTACIGIANARESGPTPEDLLRDAAVALYEAKRRGKDSAELFRPAMRDDRNELVTLESDLRRAVERGEIEVHYQPIARLSDMDLAGFEALVRWRHPSLGLLGPERFLKIAEQTGLIKDLGRHVLIEAGRQLGIWQRAFRPTQPLFVAVNVSSSQLVGSALVEDVQSVLARESIIRDTFKIEVTESVVMENPELAAQILDRLKLLGVGLSCDDFGTGYSSLSNLRRLPFDTLKIDRAFLEAEMVDERAYIILRNIIALAHDLGLVLVAEGIESQEHIDRLSAHGCQYGQGFFIGQPMTAKQVIDALSGVPYSGSKKNVMTLLWERMVGDRSDKRKEEPAIAPPPSLIDKRETRRRRPPPPPPEPELIEEEDVEVESPSEMEPIKTAPELVAEERVEPEPASEAAVEAAPEAEPLPAEAVEEEASEPSPIEPEAVEQAVAEEPAAIVPAEDVEVVAELPPEEPIVQKPQAALLGERLRRRQRRRQGGRPGAA
ncbi:MAG: EAL domain-containing protein [Rhizobiales bacterium]|nr:EAL domain-containing protein [Hyphomicrobiales bacterium]